VIDNIIIKKLLQKKYNKIIIRLLQR